MDRVGSVRETVKVWQVCLIVSGAQVKISFVKLSLRCLQADFCVLMAVCAHTAEPSV